MICTLPRANRAFNRKFPELIRSLRLLKAPLLFASLFLSLQSVGISGSNVVEMRNVPRAASEDDLRDKLELEGTSMHFARSESPAPAYQLSGVCRP